MTSGKLYEDHQNQQKGIPLAQRAATSLKNWIAPVAAAALLLAQPLQAQNTPDPSQPSQPSQNPNKTTQEAFLIGEIHGHQPSAAFTATYLEELKKKGYNSFALEIPKSLETEFKTLLKKPTQDAILYQTNGLPASIPKEIIQLAKKAQSLGMDIHCIDADMSKKMFEDIIKLGDQLDSNKISEEEFVKQLQKSYHPRNHTMAKNLQEIPGKTAALVGAYHTGGPISIDALLEKRGIPTKTLDLLPKSATNLVSELFQKYQKPTDVTVTEPEKGVQRKHLTILEDPLNPETLQNALEEYQEKNPETNKTAKRKQQNTKTKEDQWPSMS